MRRALAISAFSLAVSKAASADESSTGALLKFPYITDNTSVLYHQEWEVAPAQFGYHDYGGSLTGWLVIPKNTSYRTGCKKEPSDSNEYVHWVNDWNVEGSDDAWMLLLDVEDCYFVQKAENAQSQGASAVIVMDNKQESLYTMWPPDGYQDDIDIPSVLLGYTNSRTLMKEIGVENWETSSVSYPNASGLEYVVARLEWGLPHTDDRVEYTLWTSANDFGSVKFKKHWETTGIYMEYGNYTEFNPHFYILDGHHYHCDNGLYLCGRQCSNGGRYCAPDPEYDLTKGLDGIDVVHENLRSLCVWNYVMEDPIERNQSVWWDYAILWDHNCANSTDTFTKKCSYSQMESVVPGLSNYVSNCIDESGGYGYTDGKNTLLESEMKLRDSEGIYGLPTVIVNEYMVHGNIDCDHINERDCQVLDAICAGFLEGTEPKQCDYTPAPTPQVCPEEDKDCRGVCYGRYVTDQCGQCLVSSDPRMNSCLDCNGNANGTAKVDCRGVCGGEFELNDCGVCLDKSTENWENEGKDCAGVCEGESVIDQCGQCLLASDPNLNSCVDCAGVANGNATVDCTGECGGTKQTNPCGLCMERSQQNWQTEGQDCNGDCEGKAELDSCGNCLMLSDEDWNACQQNDDSNGDGSDDDGSSDGNSDSSNSGNNSKKKTDYTATIVIAVGSFVLLCLAALVIRRLQARQTEVDTRMKAIMEKYELMDEESVRRQNEVVPPPPVSDGANAMELTQTVPTVPEDEDNEGFAE